jgi:predicted nucleic acid-binding protein
VTVFVDTNVLLYAQDPRDAYKQKAAERWLSLCWREHLGAVSTQVLNELYATLRRVAPSLAAGDARAIVRRYRGWKCWTVDEATVDLAWLLQDRFTLSYWDGLMVAAAQQLGCRYLLTEDLNHERRFDNVQVINPFKADIEILGKP